MALTVFYLILGLAIEIDIVTMFHDKPFVIQLKVYLA